MSRSATWKMWTRTAAAIGVAWGVTAVHRAIDADRASAAGYAAPALTTIEPVKARASDATAEPRTVTRAASKERAPCTESHRVCFGQARAAMETEARNMLTAAHAVEREIAAARMAGGGFDRFAKILRDMGDKLNEPQTRFHAAESEMQLHEYWGLGFKSAADFATWRVRLMSCSTVATVMRMVILEFGEGQSDKIAASVASLAAYLPLCEAGVGVKAQSTPLRADMKAVERECAPLKGAGLCRPFLIKADKLRDARERQNDDKLPPDE